MFRRKLPRKAPDPERDELKRLIRAADAVPPPMKALAVLGVSRMTRDQVRQALDVVPILMAAAQARDRDGIQQCLIDQGLDAETVADAMSYYDMMAGVESD
jgi:hypothetical protein